ncbi:hypothetical protein GQ53DRAFT_839388 [Thozetella sp. PMI_491]|nr:hypothetical protein GQ53DRAFT_839388 [Thozetella sp. PMI_491]
MDHFNATVQNGHLVHTRRGLQVSKQKFNGLSFVNSYPQAFTPGTSSAKKSGTSEPTPQREFRFVSKGQEPKPESTRRQRREPEDGETSLQPGLSLGRKGKRRVAKDQMSTASSTSDSSSRRSSQTSSPVMSEGLRTPTFLSTQPFDLSPSPGASPLPSGQQQHLSAQDLPTYMSAENRKLFHHYFAYVPRNIYPYEDILTYNPIKSSDFYYMVIKDLAALHCVLMTGSISEMVLNESLDSKGFSYHISKICAILNRKLGQNKGVDPVTVECILALALMGSCVGRLDHWYMHMRGLQKVIEMNGGLSGLGPALISKIHKTDLKGAVALATTPYIPFARSFSPVSTVVPLLTRNQATSILTESLSSLQISPITITSLTNLAIFTSAVRLARSTTPPTPSPGSSASVPTVPSIIPIAFDPHAFTDELHAVTHDLLVHPAPLRDPSTTGTGPANPFNPPDDPSDIPSAAATAVDEPLANENYITNHRLHLSGGLIIPSPLGEGGHLEPALRIAGLLYLKELLPDWPRNVGGYAVLLDLLATHLRGIMGTISGLDRAGAGMEGSLVSQGLGMDEPELANLDPALFEASGMRRGSSGRASSNSTSTVKGKGRRMSGLRLQELRPAVLWLCAFGNLVSLIADKNESRSSPDECYQRTIFRECLVEVAGVASVEDVDCLTEDDMVFFGLFDLRNLQGDEWDDRSALRALAAEVSL